MCLLRQTVRVSARPPFFSRVTILLLTMRPATAQHCDSQCAIPPGELAEAVRRRRRAGLHGLVGQVALRRPRRTRWPSRSGGCGPSPAPSSRSSRARRAPACSAWPAPVCRLAAIAAARRRVVLSRVLGLGGSSSRMMPQHLVRSAACLNRSLVERRRAGQQLVQQHAQRIDVAARVDVELVSSACSGLMYCGVPIIWPKPVNSVLLGQLLARSPWPRRSRSPWAPAWPS